MKKEIYLTTASRFELPLEEFLQILENKKKELEAEGYNKFYLKVKPDPYSNDVFDAPDHYLVGEK